MPKSCPVCSKNVKETSRFCSRKCAGLYGARKSIKKSTGIEIKVRELLIKIGAEFEEQKIIVSCRTIPDFYLPKYNLVIYTDGTYWHRSKRRQFCDARINKRLGKAGFNVLRYQEEDINNNINWVASDIKNTLQSLN